MQISRINNTDLPLSPLAKSVVQIRANSQFTHLFAQTAAILRDRLMHYVDEVHRHRSSMSSVNGTLCLTKYIIPSYCASTYGLVRAIATCNRENISCMVISYRETESTVQLNHISRIRDIISIFIYQ